MTKTSGGMAGLVYYCAFLRLTEHHIIQHIAMWREHGKHKHSHHMLFEPRLINFKLRVNIGVSLLIEHITMLR